MPKIIVKDAYTSKAKKAYNLVWQMLDTLEIEYKVVYLEEETDEHCSTCSSGLGETSHSKTECDTCFEKNGGKK